MSKHTTLDQLRLAQQRTKTEVGKVDTRVKALEAVGAQANVLEGIKVNGVAQAIAEKIVDILITTGSANGTISVAGVDVSVAGLAALAYKAEVGEDELSSEIMAAINAAASASDLEDLSDKIDTLIGNVSGDDAKSVRSIAAEEVAAIVNGADTSYDTLKEIADWIMNDTTGAAKMASDISDLKTKLTLGTHEVEGEQVEYATVKAYVEAVVNGLDMSNFYNKTQVDNLLNGKVDAVTGKGLSTNDFTDTYKTQLDNLSSDLNGKVDKETGKGLSTNDFTDAYKTQLDNITTATDSEVTAMLDDVWGSGD